MMPQFAGAKLHLICQITKLLAIFLLQNAHFMPFKALFQAHFVVLHLHFHDLTHRTSSVSQPFFLFFIQVRREFVEHFPMIVIEPRQLVW